jgi:hypothetical protein
MTCLACGNTFAEGRRCEACTTDDNGHRLKVTPPAVPTISYLYAEEYELA